MKLKAELVLHDCTVALSKHSSSLQGTEFRLSWWTVISLLRAIGHVLKEVDSKISDKHQKIIEEEYQKIVKTKPYPEIYWEFIKPIRNSYLKEYEYKVRRQLTNTWQNEAGEIASLSVFLDDQTEGRIVNCHPHVYQESFIQEGPFKGEDESKVAMQALYWWKSYIENIKNKINKS